MVSFDGFGIFCCFGAELATTTVGVLCIVKKTLDFSNLGEETPVSASPQSNMRYLMMV